MCAYDIDVISDMRFGDLGFLKTRFTVGINTILFY